MRPLIFLSTSSHTALHPAHAVRSAALKRRRFVVPHMGFSPSSKCGRCAEIKTSGRQLIRFIRAWTFIYMRGFYGRQQRAWRQAYDFLCTYNFHIFPCAKSGRGVGLGRPASQSVWDANDMGPIETTAPGYLCADVFPAQARRGPRW